MIDWNPAERYAGSLKYSSEAKQVTPGGAQTRSRRPAAFVEGAYPTALLHGADGKTTDVDGHIYVDLLMGLASVGIGHGHPAITEAVCRQAKLGVSLSLPAALEAEYAGKLLEALRWPEMVRFIKTGSEATEAAIRVARSYTGRDLILTVKGGYHSWHSWFQATSERHPGVPREYGQLVKTFPYNDLEAVRRCMENEGFAAVIMEPMLLETPNPGFLIGVADLCQTHGTLLIFDEMVCGFRWAIGGGGEYFEVQPDLACFGKAMANGYPLACLVGSRDVMQHAEVVSGTFGGEAIGLAAGMATLEVYQQEDVITRQWQIGRKMVAAVKAGLYESNILAVITGMDVHPRVDFLMGEQSALAQAIFIQEMARYGVLMHPAGWNVCARHTDADVARVQTAATHAGEAIAYAADHDQWCSVLRGTVPEVGFRPVRP